MGISDDLHKLMMAGVGAASIAAEKTQEAIDVLSKRGEDAWEQSKETNERLRHDSEQTSSEASTPVAQAMDVNAILAALDSLTTEERAAIQTKLHLLATTESDAQKE